MRTPPSHMQPPRKKALTVPEIAGRLDTLAWHLMRLSMRDEHLSREGCRALADKLSTYGARLRAAEEKRTAPPALVSKDDDHGATTKTLKQLDSSLLRIRTLYELAGLEDGASADSVIRRLKKMGRKSEANELTAALFRPRWMADSSRTEPQARRK